MASASNIKVVGVSTTTINFPQYQGLLQKPQFKTLNISIS